MFYFHSLSIFLMELLINLSPLPPLSRRLRRSLSSPATALITLRKKLYLVSGESMEIKSFSCATALSGREPQWRGTNKAGCRVPSRSSHLLRCRPEEVGGRSAYLTIHHIPPPFFFSFFFLLQPTDNINAAHLFEGIRGISLLSI